MTKTKQKKKYCLPIITNKLLGITIIIALMLLSAAEHLEKSREIIKRLKEEKKQIVIDMEEKLRQAEDQAEVEKDKLVQEVSRGKSAAISLLQVCFKFLKWGWGG